MATSTGSPDRIRKPELDPARLLSHDAFVRGLARSLVRDENVADDLVQDTWLAAIQHAPENRPCLRNWLAVAVRYLAGKRRRADTNRNRRHRLTARSSAVPSTAEIVEREAVRAQVVKAVLDLQEPYRSAMLLRFFEHLPPREIAKRLSVPTETVRTRIKRALAMLRKRLDDNLNHGSERDWRLVLLPFVPPLAPAATTGVCSASLGLLIMTTKAKIATVAATCAVVLCAFLYLQRPDTEPGTPPVANDSTVADQKAESKTEPAVVLPTPQEETTPERTEVEKKPEEPKTGLGSVLVQAVWKDDGTPAAGVVLRVRPFAGDTLFDARVGTTDEQGRFLATGLKPLRIYAEAIRGGMGGDVARGEVVAEETIDLKLEIPIGVNLRGIVVDAMGDPVPGARIISAEWSGGSARAISKSDGDGRFHLRSIGTHCHVGARATGHGPSPLHTIVGSKGGNLEIRLQLSAKGGAVSGRVLGPAGEPVENAVVQIGSNDRRGQINFPDGSHGKPPMAVRLRSDASGRFRATGLAIAEHAVAVRGLGLAPWMGKVQVQPVEGSELVVHLKSGATLEGIVRNDKQEPVAKVEIKVGDYGEIGHQRVRSNVDGKYRFEGLAIGKLNIEAEEAKAGKASVELTAMDGQALRWDPVLSNGLVLRGQVLDPDSKPVANAMIEAFPAKREPGDKFFGFEKTDADGRFELKNCIPGRIVQMRVHARGMKPTARNKLVTPGSQDILIRLLSEEKASAFIKGKIVYPDGRAVEDCAVNADPRSESRGSAVRTTEAGTGAFKYGPFPPGEYRLRIRAKGYPVHRTLWRTLAADETWNAGTITLKEPGTVRVQLKAASGTLPAKTQLSILDTGFDSYERLTVEGDSGVSKPITPGRYFVQVRGAFACAQHEFEIQSGQETQLQITLQRGTPVSLRFSLPEPTDNEVPALAVTLEVKDSNKNIVLRTFAVRRRGAPVIQTGFTLRPGSYRLRTWTESGRKGETTLDVGDTRATLQEIKLK